MRANDTAGAPVPFQEFAQGVQVQSALRARISDACRRPETECLPPLLSAASLAPADAEAARSLARQLVIALRRKQHDRGGSVAGLIQEYSLSSQEGVALMCLAEALLRIPDSATRDAMIRDKISTADWQAHLGNSPSLFVNAATWGLLITGKLDRHHLGARAHRRHHPHRRPWRRTADPQGRGPGPAHDGRAIRHRADDCRGHRQQPRAGGQGFSLQL